MLNLNFASEFARRADLVYKDDSKFEQVFGEYQSLDSREASFIYQTFEYQPGTVEHTHAKTRLSAMVAAGTISQDLAYLANLENIPSNDNVPPSYYDSRFTLQAELAKYNEAGTNRLDPTGKLDHMIDRGDSKARLVRFLKGSTYYNSLLDLLDSKDELDDTDIAPRVEIFKFEQFLDALDKVEDLPTPPDFAEKAKKAIAKYDTNGKVAALIDDGARSLEVFNALAQNPVWLEDAQDYLTRDDVESPRYAQTESWNIFLATVNAIKDLNDR